MNVHKARISLLITWLMVIYPGYAPWLYALVINYPCYIPWLYNMVIYPGYIP